MVSRPERLSRPERRSRDCCASPAASSPSPSPASSPAERDRAGGTAWWRRPVVWGLTAAFSGQAFAYYGITAWLPLLLRDERQLARNYLRRLTTYATGREPGFADRPAIEAILDKCAQVSAMEKANFGAYRMRSLIEELVTSELFLSK